MPKAYLSFTLPDDSEEFEQASKAGKVYAALFDVGQQVFRPARKHGYDDSEISDLLKSLPDDKGEELIGLLEQRYYRILQEWDIET